MAPSPSLQSSPEDMSATTLFEMFNNKFRGYIDLIDQLRAYGLENEFPLPQVVVLGVQSSGKSSVLEAISGVSLPRGTGIVTRCPLEMRMKYARTKQDWKCILTCSPPGAKELYTVNIESPAEVANQISKAQALLTQNKSISTTAITLDITSPDVPDLTLIDLPGITEVAFANQDEMIVEQIKGLARSYIMRKDTLILVVAACNADLATTKALRMANEVDKDGERTIGVLTKVDLVDKGAEKDITRIMMNPDMYKVRKGFTLVKLRSQQAIDSSQSLEDSLKEETMYFETHPHYSKLKPGDVGVRNLARKLKEELVMKIQNTLPILKEAVVNRLETIEHQLKVLGNDLPREGPERETAFRDMLDVFKEMIRKICEGPYDNNIRPGMRLLYHIRPKVERFAQHMDTKLPDDDDREFQENAKKEIIQTRANALPGFLPYQACRNIVQQRIDMLKDPVDELLKNINGEVDKILRTAAEEHFQQYPTLASHIRLMLDESRKQAYTACMADIEDMFHIESLVYVPDILFRKYEFASSSNQRSQTNVKGHPSPSVPVQNGHEADKTGKDKNNDSSSAHTSANQKHAEPNSKHPNSHGADAASKYGEMNMKYSDSQRPYNPTNDVEFVLQQIITYMQMAIDRITGVVPMRVHHYLITKLYITIRSRMTELGSDYVRMDKLAEDDFTRQTIEDLATRKECLQRCYIELSEF